MPCFKALKDRMNLWLGASVAGNLKPMIIYHSENPRAVNTYAKSTLPMLYKGSNRAWMTLHLFTIRFTEYLKSIFEVYCSKIPFKILLFMDNALDHSRALMKMYSDFNVVFMPINILPST